MSTSRNLVLAAALATALAALALATSGCATTGTGTVGDPDVITREQIQESNARNVHELIEHLRPRWLQQRFVRSLRLETTTLVYQNESKLGGIEVLRDIPLQGIQSIRFIDAAQAGRLPGARSDAVDAAILITTSKPAVP